MEEMYELRMGRRLQQRHKADKWELRLEIWNLAPNLKTLETLGQRDLGS
jgi:hypothetical protein